MKIAFAISLAALLAISSCDQMTSAEREEVIARMWPRPADVPATAILHAGEDGGHWADCRFEENELGCDIYHVRGGLEFRQAFQICVNDEPGSLAGGAMGIHETGFPIGKGTLLLVPVNPQQLAGAEPDLQEKVDKDFEAAQPLSCAIQLAPVQPE